MSDSAGRVLAQLAQGSAMLRGPITRAELSESAQLRQQADQYFEARSSVEWPIKDANYVVPVDVLAETPDVGSG